MAIMKGSDFIALMFDADTAVTFQNPAGNNFAMTWPGGTALMSSLDVDFTGTALVMTSAHRAGNAGLSGFVVDKIVTQ